MTFAARILLFDSEPSRSRGLADKLTEQGYHNMLAGTIEDVLAMTKNEHPDLVIVQAGLNGSGEPELHRTLRNIWRTSRTPAILIGAGGHRQKFLDQDEPPIAEFMSAEFPDAELVSHIASLMRLHTMHEELRRRATTAEEFGINPLEDISPPDGVNGARVLIVTNDSEQGWPIQAALDSFITVAGINNRASAMDALLDDSIDAAIIDAHEGDGASLELCSDIRNNTRLFNLPLVLIAERDDLDDPAGPYLSGVNDVVYRPFTAEDLRLRVALLIRQHRYRRAMQGVYRRVHDDMTTDRLTGLYGHGFLHAHLERQVAHAHRWRKNLSVGFFDVRNMSAINQNYGYVAGDRLLRQIGSVIGNLLRGEDLAARYAGEEFCVVQPDTAPEVSVFALQRIGGVVSNTEFAVPNVGQSIRLILSVGSTSIEPDDTVHSLLARARARSMSEHHDPLHAGTP